MSRTWPKTVALCLFAVLAIASDCKSLLGANVYALKYVGVAILCILCVASSVRRPVPRKRLACTLAALFLLLAIVPFQKGSFSPLESAGLYLAVAVLACLSLNLLDSTRQLLAVCLVASLAVFVLLVASRGDVAAQWSFYVDIGRPRFKGCFSNPNSLGNIAAVLLIGTLCARCGEPLSRRLGVASIIGIALDLALVVGSGSRTALATVVAFAATYWIAQRWRKAASWHSRALLLVLSLCDAVVLAAFAWWIFSVDVTFNSRVDSLLAIDLSDSRSIVGIGYVASEGVAQLTEAAGGVTEMLYVSLFYRVGLIGVAAYVLFVAAALLTGACNASHARCAAVAVLVAVLAQSVGESYLSSVMSFVSCFDWVLLAAVPRLLADERAGCGT